MAEVDPQREEAVEPQAATKEVASEAAATDEAAPGEDEATEAASGEVEAEASGKGFLAKLFAQFVKFGIVGVTNTIISYVIYAVMVYLGCHYLIASITSFVISVLWSFYWNNRMVFTLEEGQQRSIGRALVKTFASYALTGLVLANVLLFVEIDLLGVNAYIAPIINLVITVPLNFFLNRNWAFRAK